jgi:DNA repair protein RadC
MRMIEAENVPDRGDVFLNALGLTVLERQVPTGETIYRIEGDTHPYRHTLRELGGRWDKIEQCWVFTASDPRPALVGKLSVPTASSGMSDSATLPQFTNRPSYWGHRQRLRERFLGGSDDAIPDYELLELLLFFSIQRIDTKPLAKDLLKEFGSIGGVVHAAADRLAKYEQINHHTITLFKAVRAIAARLAREDMSEGPLLTNWNKLIAYLRASMAHRNIEQFRVLFLDRRNVLIADEVQNEGSIDHTPVYPREVVKRALTLDASALIMVHNHPSNHPAPSPADIEMTRLVKQALESVGVALHDHVIISRKGHTSFKQMRLL